jgi:hypothetical protein
LEVVTGTGQLEPPKGFNPVEERIEMNRSGHVLVDYYQCPEEFVRVGVWGISSEKPGFFCFGPDGVCYGKCSAFDPSPGPESPLNNALSHVRSDQRGIKLPFDIADAVSALRFERYMWNGNGAGTSSILQKSVRAAYYAIRPVTPVAVRKHLQRYSLRGWDKMEFPRWPVDTSVESTIETAMRLNMKAQGLKELPFIWFWPDGARACAVMTHDVETAAGRDFCSQLMDINDSFGIKSSFQVVPERRYDVPESFLRNIRTRGFEVNVHDLNHDGNLFKDYKEFKRRAADIEKYRKMFDARGFRAGVLYRNIDWFDLLHFEYDMSVPNVAHLDPQRGGCCTTFPFFIGDILEIPVTMTQDYSLFNILRNYKLDLWEEQMDVIRKKHGMMNFIVHPDYIINQREQSVYKGLLGRLSELRRTAGLWTALPGELNEWWRQRNRMKLVRSGSGWEIKGEGKVRARIAYARLVNGKLGYSL